MNVLIICLFLYKNKQITKKENLLDTNSKTCAVHLAFGIRFVKVICFKCREIFQELSNRCVRISLLFNYP
jgi:hypothetical protein